MICAVIPTGNRPHEYQSVIDWCGANGIVPITIATSDEAQAYASGMVISDHTLNISKWWNLGIKAARSKGAEYILILNDDVVLPDEWLKLIIQALDAGHSGASGQRPVGKISGYAFGLSAKDAILADEQLVWWYGDDDIQRQCELLGGFAVIPDLPVENKYANSSYYTFEQQILQDRAYYHQKWPAR